MHPSLRPPNEESTWATGFLRLRRLGEAEMKRALRRVGAVPAVSIQLRKGELLLQAICTKRLGS